MIFFPFGKKLAGAGRYGIYVALSVFLTVADLMFTSRISGDTDLIVRCWTY